MTYISIHPNAIPSNPVHPVHQTRTSTPHTKSRNERGKNSRRKIPQLGLPTPRHDDQEFGPSLHFPLHAAVLCLFEDADQGFEKIAMGVEDGAGGGQEGEAGGGEGGV
jgi:hypothetical protein